MNTVSADKPRVIVLHGIWNARAWVGPLAWRLRARGFQVGVFGYPSVFGGPDVAVPSLIGRLRGQGPVSLVGHSLGGLVVLEALRQAPELDVPRVVCLGSPLCGSETARHGRAQVGLVAGSVPHGLGALMGALHGDSDGTVALAETRLPGLADHCVVPVSHSGLVLSPEVAALVAAFLRDGRFGAAAAQRAA